MIFYYDAILGLQYYSHVDENFLIDIAVLPELTPEETSRLIEECRYYMREVGVVFWETETPNPAEQLTLPILTNNWIR